MVVPGLVEGVGASLEARVRKTSVQLLRQIIQTKPTSEISQGLPVIRSPLIVTRVTSVEVRGLVRRLDPFLEPRARYAGLENIHQVVRLPVMFVVLGRLRTLWTPREAQAAPNASLGSMTVIRTPPLPVLFVQPVR